MTTEKKKRTPRGYQDIERGALAMELEDRVALVKSLKQSIESEVKSIQEKSNAAGTLLSTLNGAATAK